MPYRAKEAIHSDVSPTGDTFNGKLLSADDPKGNFVVKGKNGIFTDKEAEKFNLAKSPLVEEVDLDKLAAEHEKRAQATHTGVVDVALAPAPAVEETGKQSEATPEAEEQVREVIAESQAIRSGEAPKPKAAEPAKPKAKRTRKAK